MIRPLKTALSAMIFCFILSPFAFPGEVHERILSVDPLTRLLILEDGNVYEFSPELQIDSLVAGDSISVIFQEHNGRRIISSYHIR